MISEDWSNAVLSSQNGNKIICSFKKKSKYVKIEKSYFK